MPRPIALPGGARWIGDRRRATKGEPPCPYLRHSFALPGPIRRATLQWTALGVADVFLNGDKVGEDFLMPGWSDFRHRAQVMSADVTAMLRPGDNILGPSSATDGIPAHCSGRTSAVTTGRSWQIRNGAVLFSDIYHGESYDARRDVGGLSARLAPVDELSRFEPGACANVYAAKLESQSGLRARVFGD